MTVHVFIHLNAKRAETVSLLDLGATENFLNLNYAKWLKLPIKRLSFPRKLFNVDGTENKAGQLQFYTDLAIRTGMTTTNMRFFLTQLGEHKAILGYPWFAAIQPKIDWSPYTANFFFVKKKDRKLCPVRDYRLINKWTKHNQNVSPLIPQVIDRLRGCTLFTKVDVQWGYNNI